MKFRLLLACATAAVTATAILVPVPATAASTVNLLAGYDWNHMAGATTNASGVVVSGLGRKIVNQDATGGQANPPVNMRGPRLHTDGDFKVVATMATTGSGATYLHLYDEVPVIYDEWRQEPAGLRIGIVGGQVEVTIWDGFDDNPVTPSDSAAAYPVP